jgi:hypothetical protein
MSPFPVLQIILLNSEMFYCNKNGSLIMEFDPAKAVGQ